MRKDDFEFLRFDDLTGIIKEGYSFPKIVIGNFLQVLEEADYVEHYRVYIEDSLGDESPYLIAEFRNDKSLSDTHMEGVSSSECLNIFYKLLEFPEEGMPRSKKGGMLIALYIYNGTDKERKKIHEEFARRFASIKDNYYNLISFRACVDGKEIKY